MKILSALLVAAIMIAGLSACRSDNEQEFIDCIKNTGTTLLTPATQACMDTYNGRIKACHAAGGTNEECKEKHA